MPNTRRLPGGFCHLLALATLCVVTVAGAHAATVSTNKPDYVPGEVVVITGTGWQPGETVSLLLEEEPANYHPLTLSAVADESGNLRNDDFIVREHDLGATFTLTATGLTSGETVQMTFTDGPCGNGVVDAANE